MYQVSKPEKVSQENRYVLLDGIRGLAALFVCLRHTIPFWTFGFGRSYLAVDLFFLLSGFVIAHAYDDKLKTKAMGVGKFLVTRLIRIYPVYLVSLVLCLILWAGQMDVAALPLLMALFFIPWPMAGNNFLFSLNAPYWSLLFELITNFLYAVVRRWLTTGVLMAVVISAALGLVALSVFTGSMDYGWNWGPKSIFGGGVRSIFGVFLGLLIHRFREPLGALVGRFLSPWIAFILVALALATPLVGFLDPVVDLIFLMVVFPILILAASRYTGGRGQTWVYYLGAASYPLYVLHQQLGLLLQSVTGTWVVDTAPWSGFLFLALLILVSVVIERTFDLPLRRWLKSKFFPGKRTE